MCITCNRCGKGMVRGEKVNSTVLLMRCSSEDCKVTRYFLEEPHIDSEGNERFIEAHYCNTCYGRGYKHYYKGTPLHNYLKDDKKAIRIFKEVDEEEAENEEFLKEENKRREIYIRKENANLNMRTYRKESK